MLTLCFRKRSFDAYGDVIPPAPGSPDGSPKRSPVEFRRVADAQTLRALTHPTRIALIEVLSIDGPHTATEAAEKVGESPSSCSFHLRQLARYGFVEEAGGGAGRRRPWKMTRLGMEISSDDDDPAAQVAASALSRLVRGRMLDRYETWTRTSSAYPRAWRDAAFDSEFVFWMTPEELNALSARLHAELTPLLRERLTDPSLRPAGALPVELLTTGFPIAPPPEPDPPATPAGSVES